MKRSSTFFLKAVVALIGITALLLMLWEPRLEGRNAHASLFEIYFKDPFLACAYIASIPFFTALFQAFKLLGYAERNKAFSQGAVDAARMIKYCALATAASIVAIDAYLMIAARGKDDPAGAVMLGIASAFASIVIAAAAAVLERILQNAMDIKSENDLTV